MISFLIQSDACQLPADAHSLTAIAPGLQEKAPSLVPNTAPTFIAHNSHLLPITAKKQQQSLKLSDNAPFHFPKVSNLSGVYRRIVLLGAAKGLILNTGFAAYTFPGL